MTYEARLATASDDAPVAWIVVRDGSQTVWSYSWRSAHKKYHCMCDEHDMTYKEAQSRAKKLSKKLNERVGPITNVRREQHGGVEYVAFDYCRRHYLYQPYGGETADMARSIIRDGIEIEVVYTRAHSTGSKVYSYPQR